MKIDTSGERRRQPRRESDKVLDALYRSFSTTHCHLCLQNWGESVLLLNTQKRLLYATPDAQILLKEYAELFIIQPVFTFAETHAAAKFKKFSQNETLDAVPMCIFLDPGKNGDKLLISCHKLPTSEQNECIVARYLLKLHQFNHQQSFRWQAFVQQYHFTTAEARLCTALLKGASLIEYSQQWGIRIGTARNQLHSVLNKTATHRQIELLRLMDFYLWS